MKALYMLADLARVLIMWGAFSGLVYMAMNKAIAVDYWTATTIGLDGNPSFTYGSVINYGRSQQLNATTIDMDGDFRILQGELQRGRAVDTLRAMEVGPDFMPRFTFGSMQKTSPYRW